MNYSSLQLSQPRIRIVKNNFVNVDMMQNENESNMHHCEDFWCWKFQSVPNYLLSILSFISNNLHCLQMQRTASHPHHPRLTPGIISQLHPIPSPQQELHTLHRIPTTIPPLTPFHHLPATSLSGPSFPLSTPCPRHFSPATRPRPASLHYLY